MLIGSKAANEWILDQKSVHGNKVSMFNFNLIPDAHIARRLQNWINIPFLKFLFSKKVSKIDEISTLDLKFTT